MPQFDIFSFFSQIFWVFTGFTFFYLILSFFLLPSLSAILKVRKHKLAQTNTFEKSDTLTNNFSNSVIVKSNNLIVDFSAKLVTVNSDSFQAQLKPLNNFLIKVETFRKLKVTILNKIQLIL